ncbi:MAG: hypothetical protein AUG51_15275 [Acidobacteria bacterium 13_1_20CM_3_53_8]|nr:MAG: hypothetical protein AUG51_15275 [Acidobacteria bacterium 13_1_20CM_3_53_8]
MRHISATIIVLLISASAIFAQDRQHSLTVDVRDAQSRPVKRACVTVIPRSGDIIFGQTDAHGRFKVKNLEEGAYRVVVKSSGFSMQKRNVEIGAEVNHLTFTLQERSDWPVARGEQR